MALRPIETHYNGYRFRSRLEARWAVFFDALGWTYQYEPQGFLLPDDTPVCCRISSSPRFRSGWRSSHTILRRLNSTLRATSRSKGIPYILYGDCGFVPEHGAFWVWYHEDESALLSATASRS